MSNHPSDNWRYQKLPLEIEYGTVSRSYSDLSDSELRKLMKKYPDWDELYVEFLNRTSCPAIGSSRAGERIEANKVLRSMVAPPRPFPSPSMSHNKKGRLLRNIQALRRKFLSYRKSNISIRYSKRQSKDKRKMEPAKASQTAAVQQVSSKPSQPAAAPEAPADAHSPHTSGQEPSTKSRQAAEADTDSSSKWNLLHICERRADQ